MTDWADEITEECRWLPGSVGALAMARALRKAKADGMRTASSMLTGEASWSAVMWVDEEADKVERGEA